MYFVNYSGNLDVDPLNRGIEAFETFDSLFDFVQMMKNKGLKIEIYEAQKVTDEEFRSKILESLTAESQALGLYD